MKLWKLPRLLGSLVMTGGVLLLMVNFLVSSSSLSGAEDRAGGIALFGKQS